MSWLGGSISSLTGQLSNLTKDILTEGTEEVSDHATELRLAKEKIGEFQTLCGALKTENDRLKFLNRELEEKAESSELQINSISTQYRDVLQEKENELKELKKQHHAILEHQAKSALLSPLATPSGGQLQDPAHQGTSSSSGFEEGVPGSDWDLGDNICLQREINRLSQEASRLKSEAQHWKSVAGQLSQSGTSHDQFESNNAEIIQLRDRVQELELQVCQARENQQHEVVSLQDVYTEKMATLKKKHKQEVAEYKQQITALEHQLSEGRDSDSVRHGSSNLPEADRAGLGVESADIEELKRELSELQVRLSRVDTEKSKIESTKRHLEGVLQELQSEVTHLQDERDGYLEKISHLDSTVSKQRTELETLKQASDGQTVIQLQEALEKARSEKSSLELELRQVGLALFDAKQQLLDHLDANHADTLELLGDLQHARHQMSNEGASRRNHLLEEKQRIANQIYVLGQKQGEVKSTLVEAKALTTHLSHEAAAIIESLGNPAHQQLTAELVGSLEKENQYLKELNLKNMEQITLLERAAITQSEERSHCEETITKLRQQLRQGHADDESSTISTLQDSLSVGSDRSVEGSDLSSELSRRNRELDLKVDELQDEVNKYKNDIEQFEYVKSDWQMEKEALEEVLLQLREQLREKEVALNIALAQKGLAEVQRQEKKSMKQSTERNVKGEVVEETIVPEHEDLLQTGETTLEADIETFTVQAQKLSDANQLLEEERDQLEAEKAALEDKVMTLEKKLLDQEKKSQQAEEQATPPDEHLQQKVNQQEEMMKVLVQDKLDLESSLEELDTQHQQAMDKLIQIRDGLSQQVDSLTGSLSLKEAEVSRLAEELDQSRSRMEDASQDHCDGTIKQKELEARIKKMESEAKSREDEIKTLNEKCQNAAVAVNDLHMDKRELEEELGKARKELTAKVAKLKEMREAQSQLTEENKELTERLQEAEDEIEDWQERNEHVQTQKSEKGNEVKELQTLQGENKELRSKADQLFSACESEKTKNTALVAENERLSTQVERLETQNKESFHQSSQSLHDRISVLETQLDAATSEKQRLEKELGQVEDRLQAQTKHYESYVQELQSSQDKDASALQQDHQAAMQSCHEKELVISELQSQINSLQSELDATKETMQTSVDSQGQLTAILKDKDEEISSLKNANTSLNCDYEEVCAHLKEQEVLMESMKDMEKLLAASKEEIQRLRTEIEVNKMNMERHTSEDLEKQKTLEIITELEKELAQANGKISSLELNIQSQETLISDYKDGIADLNEKHIEQTKEIEEERSKIARQDDMILIMHEKSAEKDEEIASLTHKLHRASSMLDEKKQRLLEEEEVIVQRHFELPALEYPEKAAIQPTKVNQEQAVRKEDEFDQSSDPEISNSIEEISKEISELQLRLQEKDQVIDELQSNNTSLLTMLEAKSLSSHGDKSLVEVHRLENEVKTLKMEREQILAVMNEKSRESSSLKTEVHRLMSVVTAEKSALNKLQQDNHQLQNRENPVDDMQKEALKNLSRLVRDRELEIEALKQKNETLLAVLQDSSQETQGAQINTLLQDKENLGKQVMVLQSEREQMIAYLNQKHQESVAYHSEIQRLTAVMSAQTEKYETLQHDYSNLVPQFEDKKQALLKLQNELLNYKQKYSELEVKHGELLGRSNVSDTVDVVTFNAKEAELQKLQEKLSELLQEQQDRDQKIQGFSQKVHELESVVSSKEAERTNLKKQADSLTFQLQGLQTELHECKSQSISTQQKSSKLDSDIQVLKDMNDKLTLSLSEKEFELMSLREKSGTLTTLLHQQKGEEGQVEHLIQENTSLHQQRVQFQQERDQAVMALKQKQAEVETLRNEVEQLKVKEMKLTRELDRLRQHLIQIEEGYTGEAIQAEEREKELRNRLANAEEKILSSTSAVQHASQAASQQVENLQHQLHSVTSQRDSAYMQMTSMQDQCQHYAASLANLQMVLEQFQQDKDAQIAADTERYQDEIKSLKDKVNTLQSTLDTTKAELEEASDGLEAASRLSEQMDRKEEAMAALKEEVLLREKALKAAEEEIRNLTTSTEAKVDKLLMKNMLIGYFQTPDNKRKEVIHMMGGILNFVTEDYEKIENMQSRWVPGFLRFVTPRSVGPTPPTTPVHSGRKPPSLDQSFSQLFVKFLEKESSPPPPPVRLPAEQMAKELQEKHKEAHKPAFNPFTAPRHVSMPLQVSTGEQTATSKPHILMAPMSPGVTQSNQLIAPVSGESLSQSSSGRSTPQGSSAILKDVLGTR